MLYPKKVKHRKWHKGRRRGKGVEIRGSELNFGSFGLKALEANGLLLVRLKLQEEPLSDI
ncbi:hypothetical protein ES703_18406 [subsurface metagenome]